MAMLIAGLVIFLGVHTLTTLRPLRARMIGTMGENGYKALYSLASLVGFLIIIYGFKGYREAGYIDIWTPPKGMRHIALLLMWPAFIALVAAYSPGRIKRALKHPMLVAVKIWALAHLLANGDLGSIILFGSFLGWAVYDRIAIKRRERAGEVGEPVVGSTLGDILAIVVGTLLYGAMLYLHPVLIGVPVIGG